jgi:hypothetical protein
MKMLSAPTTSRPALVRLVALVAVAAATIAPLESANASVITSGLIGYWAAENNANDSSATGNNGSFAGSYVPGVDGQAFDLSAQKVYIPDHPAYSFASGFSLGFWFNMDGETRGVILGQDDGGGGYPKSVVSGLLYMLCVS